MYVDPQIIEYAVRLSTATRDPAAVGSADLARYVTFGASPRASINMVLGAKALAFLRGRDYALPGDVRELARDVLRHRIVLSYEALADDVSPDDVLGPLLAAVPLPELDRPPSDQVAPRGRPRADRDGSRPPCGDGPAALTPERVLRRLEWRVLRRLDGRLQGDYRTVFRGTGVDVADLREYQFGDDLRHIDWNVTARTDIAHVREYLEDREVTAWLLLDRSASMDFGPVAAAQARRAHRGRGDGGAAAVARREPGRRAAVRHRVERDDPARVTAATRCCGSSPGCCAPPPRQRGDRPRRGRCAPRWGSCGAGRSS